MSERNVEIVRRLYGFWQDRDTSSIEDVVHPDAVVDVSRNIFNPGTHRGIDGFTRFVEQIDEMWDDFMVTPDEFIDGGETVVAAHRISGTGRGSGLETEMRAYAVFTFRENKLWRLTGGLRTRDEALEVAGLKE
jgi:ketosteroid isomerase-like protein